MRFNGICIVTENVPRLCAFYRKILKLEPEGANVFDIIPTDGAELSIYSSERTEKMAPGCLKGAGNGSYTIEFEVEDVDEEFERLKAVNVEIVKPPTTQPWGRPILLVSGSGSEHRQFLCRRSGLEWLRKMSKR